MSQIIGAIVRHVLTLMGAVWAGSDAEVGEALRLFIQHLADGNTSALGGSIVTLLAIAWSIYDKTTKQKIKTKEDAP